VPQSGPYRSLGTNIIKGASLAREEFTRAAESEDDNIGMIVVDDGGLPDQAYYAGQSLLRNKVFGVIGHLNSEISAAMSLVYAAEKIPLISPASTNKGFTRIRNSSNYTFRTIVTDTAQAIEMSEFIKSEPRIKKIALLYNQNQYGSGIADQLRNRIKNTYNIVFDQSIEMHSTNHEREIAEILKLKPDLVVFIGEYSDAAFIYNEIRPKLTLCKFLASEGAFSERTLELITAKTNRFYVCGNDLSDKDFNEKFEKRFKAKPYGYAYNSYLATKSLLDSYKLNHYNSGSSLCTILKQNTLYDFYGDFTRHNLAVYKIKNDEFVKVNADDD
jgi:branched-chain amino acid transport system substrate-binding protein